MIASAGPDEWRHVTTSEWRDASTGDADAAPAPRRTGDTTVSDLEVDTDRISFTVDEVGEPVLVKASYFPNWRVSGAAGPYRVAPNPMVVVPNDEQVALSYGRAAIALFATLIDRESAGGGKGVVGRF